jgi:hypothetical protein
VETGSPPTESPSFPFVEVVAFLADEVCYPDCLKSRKLNASRYVQALLI